MGPTPLPLAHRSDRSRNGPQLREQAGFEKTQDFLTETLKIVEYVWAGKWQMW